MSRKPTYQQLRDRVRELERQIGAYARAKEALRESISKAGIENPPPLEPHVAVDVLDEGVNARKTLEQAFVAEHLFRKSIEDAVPCGLVGIDNAGIPVYANRAFFQMVQWTGSQLPQVPFPESFMTRENTARYASSIEALTSGQGADEGMEMPFRRRDGDSLWGLVFGAPMVDSRGRNVGRLFSIVDISRRKAGEDALRSLSSRLIGAQERERRLISRDLHDSIGGKLTGVKYGLESIMAGIKDQAPEALPALQDLVVAVRTTLEETQRITKNLHPSILDDLGLFAAIRGQCREFEQFYPEIDVHLDFDAREDRISRSTGVLIFRVLQEALTNVAKHSRAGHVSVRLRGEEDLAVLEIEDDGIGFEPRTRRDSRQQGGGLGIESMKERTRLFGGGFSVNSRPGKGTRIEAAWPLSSGGRQD